MKSVCEAAAGILLKQRLHSLFIDVTRLKYDMDIRFVTLRDFCRSTRMTMAEIAGEKDLLDGCTLIRKKNKKKYYLVLYNDEQKNARRRAFTLAHEIGHIYLGHIDDGVINEAQANCFASELLMPESLLRELAGMNSGRLQVQELCTVFNISMEAASLRLNRCGNRGLTEYDAIVLNRYKGLLPSFTDPIVTA